MTHLTDYLGGYTGRICLRLNLYFQHVKVAWISLCTIKLQEMFFRQNWDYKIPILSKMKLHTILWGVITNTADMFLVYVCVGIRSFIKRQTSGISSDNEWYIEWQRMTTSGTASDNKWYEWQRMTKNDIEW